MFLFSYVISYLCRFSGFQSKHTIKRMTACQTNKTFKSCLSRRSSSFFFSFTKRNFIKCFFFFLKWNYKGFSSPVSDKVKLDFCWRLLSRKRERLSEQCLGGVCDDRDRTKCVDYEPLSNFHKVPWLKRPKLSYTVEMKMTWRRCFCQQHLKLKQ